MSSEEGVQEPINQVDVVQQQQSEQPQNPDELQSHKSHQSHQSHQSKTEINLNSFLQDQINRYQQLLQSTEQEKDKKVIKQLINTLQNQVQNLNNKLDTQVNESNFGGISLINEMESHSDLKTVTRNKRLKEIYNFYCKIFYSKGPNNDFGRISDESHTMNEGKFIVFCRQFDLLDKRVHYDKRKTEPKQQENTLMLSDSIRTHKWWLQNRYQSKQIDQPSDYKLLTFKQINQIVIKSYDKHNIDFDNFINLLSGVSQIMFEGKQDSVELLYQLMEIDSLQYKKKLKSLTIPFNSKEEVGFREGIPSQYKPDIKSLERKRIQVSEWQNRKREFIRDKINDQTNNQSRNSFLMHEPSYIKSTNYQDRKSKLSMLQKKDITNWEQLERMNPQQILNEPFDPYDLIEENEDEDDKYYLQQYNSQKQSSVEPQKKQVPKTQNGRQNISTNRSQMLIAKTPIFSIQRTPMSSIRLPRLK